MISHKKKLIGDRDKASYPRETLRNAVRAVLNCHMTLHDAHREYKIPIRTIQDHVKYVM